ncbi:lipopolysaccharide biosynthesis protein [Paraclostridium bifermentans]|uniref:lipopolysaccharide biosynthesis protein n=1 Tax=Paraclostridium bifermentans TaxID=1490 RepID=UPI0024316CEF|nr:MATE family efflux transporter [Paraclostridium bifermentans]
MSTQIDNNKRIAKNTLALYFRMFLLIFVQLYTVPIILKTLGVEDYGIYNVVGGVVTMFSFIGTSLASGSQRFIAFEIGRKDQKGLKKVFDTTVSIYIILSVISLLILEIGGYWFLNTQMTIPDNRIYAANWVFQLSIISFIINLISIPYNATVIAHERMSIFAYISIFEYFLKFISAISLKYIPFDYLIVYSVLICVIAVLIRVIYQIYCYNNFEECRNFKFKWDSYKGKELLTYSGWNMIGAVALISRQQGLNIIINVFFGPLLNAAHSIGQQINGVLSQFINNIYMATRPQITKLYAKNEIDEMWSLVFRSSKLAFYLLMILSIPLLIELDKILYLWLHNVPQLTSSIGRLLIISILIETLANQIIGAFQAANRIKKYQVYSSTIILLNIPISYICLYFYPEYPLTPYYISVFLSIFYVFSIIVNAHKELNMDITKYFKEIIFNIVIVYVFTFSSVYILIRLLPPSLYRIIITCFMTVISSIIIIWTIGFDNNEKKYINKLIKQKIQRK